MTRRVLYFHHGGAIGGAPLSLAYLLEQIDRRCYQPIVVLLKPGPVEDRLRAANIEVHVARDIADFSHTDLEWYGSRETIWRLPDRLLRYAPSIRAARRAIRRHRPDLVHLNSTTLAAAGRAACLEGVPVVWHVREPVSRGFLGLRRTWLTRRIDRDAARVIAISTYDAGRLRPSPRIRVIPNFVDRSRFDRRIDRLAARRGLGVPENAAVVTMLGGVSRAKGTLTLVDAMAIVSATRSNAICLIAGPPPGGAADVGMRALGRRVFGVDAYEAAVTSAAAGAVASGRLRFLGVQSDVPSLLAATDVLTFPATVPHFARPVIEAAAMAVPVVASALGPAPELVDDGVTGLLVPAENAPALALAIGRLLDDPTLARQMGEAGYVKACRDFDAAINARRTFDVYREILG